MDPLRQRARSAWKGAGFWAVTDQCIVSAGNFAVTVAVARDVPPSELGAFGVLLGVLLTAYAVHGSLVGVPSMVLSGPNQIRRDEVPGVALTVTLLSLLAYGVVLAAAVLLVGRPGLLLPAFFALAGGQLQETLRRALMGRLEFRRAVWGDSLSYLGQAAVVVVLAATGDLSVPAAFVAMGASSLAGALVQWLQVRPRITRDAVTGGTLAPFWRLGRALVIVNGIGAVTIYSLPWLLGAMRDVRTVGSFQALLTVVSVANPLMMTANSLVTTKVAHIGGDDDPTRRRSLELRITGRYGSLIGAPLAAYCAFLLLAPASALTLFLGSDSPYGGLTNELRVLACFSAGLYAYFVLAGVLAARQDTRSMLRAQVAAAATVALAGLPLILVAGLGGALVGAVLSSLVRTAVAATAVRRDLVPEKAP